MEQPRSPRYVFSGPAEVIVESSGEKIVARVTELSLHGCYLDTTTSLPAHTPVVVKIFGPYDFFEAHSRVIYANPLLGMSVAFRHVSFFCQGVLHKWLLEAMRAKKEGEGH